MKLLIEDQILNFQDLGSGKGILLLHGWGSDLNTFSGLANILARDFRVISIDFPGFGQSPLPNNNWSVLDYSRIVNLFLKKIGLKDLEAVIGHSFGGRVIIKGISLNLISPKKIVLMGSAGVKPKNNLKRIAYAVIAKTGNIIASLPGIKIFQTKIKNKFYRLIGNYDYIKSGHMKQIFLNVIKEDLLQFAPEIKQETLLIWGALDHETPLEDGRLFQQRIPNSKLVILQDAGHYAFIDNPEFVANKILEFLK